MLKERIAEKMPELSSGQADVARFLLKSPKEAAFLTALQVGERVGVSESTVIRLATALGFSGYPALRTAVKELLMERLSTLERIRGCSSDDAALYLDAIDGDIGALKAAQESLEHEVIDELGEKIAGATKVFVAAGRSSRALAWYLCYYLSWFFPGIELLEPDNALEKISAAGENCLVMGISFPRYTSWTVEVLRHASELGVPTASLTNDHASPLAAWSRWVVSTPWNPVSFIDSFAAPLSVVNCVILSAVNTLGDGARKRLETLEELWGAQKVYASAKR